MTALTLDIARRIIATAFETAAAEGFKPLAVAVLDAGGHVIAFERQDGTSPGRFAVAHGKAYGAVMMGLPGSALMARADQQPSFIAALNGAFGGQLIPVPGGVLIRDAGGAILGAVGVTGDTSDNDATAAKAGIEAAGLVAEA